MRELFVIVIMSLSVFFLMFPAPETSAQQQTPAEQAIGQKLLEEINANIQLRIQLINAQAKIKELEDKQEQMNGKK